MGEARVRPLPSAGVVLESAPPKMIPLGCLFLYLASSLRSGLVHMEIAHLSLFFLITPFSPCFQHYHWSFSKISCRPHVGFFGFKCVKTTCAPTFTWSSGHVWSGSMFPLATPRPEWMTSSLTARMCEPSEHSRGKETPELSSLGLEFHPHILSRDMSLSSLLKLPELPSPQFLN